MFMSKLKFFEDLYLEELEIVEQEMEKHPFESSYVEEWKMLAQLITQIQIAKTR